MKKNAKRTLVSLRETKLTPTKEPIVGIIDSFNISGTFIHQLLTSKPDEFRVETVKKGKKFSGARWFQTFRKSLLNKGGWAPLEAYIIHGQRGIELPLKVIKPKGRILEILEFGGIHKYTDPSEQKKLTLVDLWDDLSYFKISRIDIAIDIPGDDMPREVHESLLKARPVIKEYKNTRYYKTKKQGKRKAPVEILKYDKGKKEGWDESKKLTRLEFQFYSTFFNKMLIHDIDKAIQKMENRIYRDSGLKIKILPIKPKLVHKQNYKSILQSVKSLSTFIFETIQNERKKISAKLNQIIRLLKHISLNIDIIINKLDKSPNCNKNRNPKFMKIDAMAFDLSVSKSFLEKNMLGIFVEGIHYTRVTDARLVRWNVKKMHAWMKGEESNESDQLLLSKLLD